MAGERARHVLHVEQLVALLLRGAGVGGGGFRRGRRPFPVGPAGVDRDGLALRVAERRQAPAERAAGIDADRVVDPLRRRHRRVAVDDAWSAPVVAGPVQSDWKAELVGFAGGLAVEGEVAHLVRDAPLQLLLHAGVGRDQPAAVQLVVTGQALDERLHPVPERLRLLLQLVQRAVKPVGALHVASGEGPRELVVVVAGERQRIAVLGGVHDEPERLHALRSPVDEVPQEDRAAAVGVLQRESPVGAGLVVPVDPVAELLEKLPQLVEAAVHVADDVERSVEGAAVAGERLPLEGGLPQLLRGCEPVPAAHALPAQALDGTPDRPAMPLDDVAGPGVGPLLVLLEAGALARVGDDRRQGRVAVPREVDELAPFFGNQIRRVDHGGELPAEAPPRDLAHHRERVRARLLAPVVVGDDAPVVVGREDLGGPEVLPDERRLPRAGGADHQDQPPVGDGQPHRSKTPVCVGWPLASSASPTPPIVTV